ncbi:hypothetical protein M7I_4171 [Glarea lozoyensis 74030]|uniref:Uncharacterized protein n=1 Tax=Glarea lozoyensis (strain ATCC 74030 / MF5533) TaxID=1104152 RepID=H0ENG7_GLAL7|nr:hypothetical protein M7I_4171 [Glarea lozoyensis 74030]
MNKPFTWAALNIDCLASISDSALHELGNPHWSNRDLSPYE